MNNDDQAHCGLCGRALKNPKTCHPNDPRMDCGGECQACVEEVDRHGPSR